MFRILRRVVVENGSFELAFEHSPVCTITVRAFLDRRGDGFGVRQTTEERYHGGLTGPARFDALDVGPVFPTCEEAIPTLAALLMEMTHTAEAHDQSLLAAFQRVLAREQQGDTRV